MQCYFYIKGERSWGLTLVRDISVIAKAFEPSFKENTINFSNLRMEILIQA